jgi:nucleotide-binding universal stress UspA family protein
VRKREKQCRFLSTAKGTWEQRLHEGKLASLKLSVASSVAVNMDVARTLLAVAEGGESVEEVEIARGCEVMAMATHGRSGVAHWVMGSVTERILGAIRLPLLIVRPQRAQTHPEEQIHAEVAEPLVKGQSWAALF